MEREKYFYKGFEIQRISNSKKVKVIAPQIGNKVIFYADSAITAKLHIEAVESKSQMRKAARELDQVLK